MTALLLLIILLTALVSLTRPWVGVIAYYYLALGQPQAMWPWIFQDIRASFYMSIAAILGTFLSIARGHASFENFRHPQPWIIFLLLTIVNLSHYFSPIAAPDDVSYYHRPEIILSIFNKMMFFYCIALVAIDTEKKFYYLAIVVVCTTIVYTYWANNVYLTGQFWRFGWNGRLSGPGNGSGDENGFASVFIAGASAVYFAAASFRNIFVKLGLLAVIPLLWHALFLTGSRAGLLSIGVISICIAYRSRSKVAGVLLIIGLVVAFLTQGGFMLNRVNDTVERNERLEQGQQLDPRLESWRVGFEIMKDYPILGVGVAKSQYVFSEYSQNRPQVSHNTIVQFGANSGFIAAGCYLVLLYLVVRFSVKNRRLIDKYKLGVRLSASNDALFVTPFGIFTMSLFLDQMVTEYIYYFFILSAVHSTLVQQRVSEIKRTQTQALNRGEILAKSGNRYAESIRRNRSFRPQIPT